MSAILVAADMHLGHENIIKYHHRPWVDAAAMDKALIEQWNETVRPNDEVWHLGDFCWRRDPLQYMKQMHGRLHFVFGNHDNEKDLARCPLTHWAGHVRYLRALGSRWWLSHYPHRSWPNSDHGSYHLFGHHHGDPPPGGPLVGRLMDVGVDAIAKRFPERGYAPLHLEEVVDLLADQPASTLRHPPREVSHE